MTPGTNIPEKAGGFSRRAFLGSSGAVAAAATLQTSATAFAQQATGANVTVVFVPPDSRMNATAERLAAAGFRDL